MFTFAICVNAAGDGSILEMLIMGQGTDGSILVMFSHSMWRNELLGEVCALKGFSSERICLKARSSSRQRLQHLCPNIIADHGIEQTRSSQEIYKCILWEGEKRTLFTEWIKMVSSALLNW